jgi:hypothetical protein
MVRLSVGLEDAGDLLADLTAALEAGTALRGGTTTDPRRCAGVGKMLS